MNRDLIYNKEYITIVSIGAKNFIDSIDYCIGNVYVFNNNIDSYNEIQSILQDNPFKKIIFIDYCIEYETLLNSLNTDYEVKFLFTKSLGSLSNLYNYTVFNSIIKMYKKGFVKEIGVLDKNLFNVLVNKKISAKLVKLDIPVNKLDIEKDDSISLINMQDDNYSSFYNELSAVKLSNKTAKIMNISKDTMNFINVFDVDYKNVNSMDELLSSSVCLNINFSDSSILELLKCMDNDSICIVGNQSYLQDYQDLAKELMVNSDDNVDEIKDKIEYVLNSKDKILSLYKDFRVKYVNDSKKSIEEFLGIELKEDEKEYDKLLTVVVPVYNTSKYLRKSLDSILASIVDDTEILVINDGSTDDSENIINEYVEKYPNLIRYIKQENHGLGSVRNVGLKEGKGKYIASVDSDDTINKMFFKEALPYLKDDIDIVIYDWNSISEDESNTFITSAIEWQLNNIQKFYGILYSTIMPSTCNKIIKRKLYDDLNIKFIEDKFEDLSTNPLVLLTAKTIKYINKPYYEYYLRSGSLMRSSAGYSMINIIKILEERLSNNKDKFYNLNKSDFDYYVYSWRIEEFIMNQLFTIEEKELKKYIDYIYENLYDICLNVFEGEKYINMLNNLKDEKLSKYIKDRNEAFKKKVLLDYVKKSREVHEEFKIKPIDIYN